MERLQQLKEDITSFIKDYNIESFDVYIDRDCLEPLEVRIEIGI